MRYRHLLLIPFLALGACAESKYPYPAQYVSSMDVPPTVLTAPPAKDSAEYRHEVQEIVALQASLTPAQIAEIKHQDQIVPENIVIPVLGERYSEARYPALYDFLKRAASDSWRIGDNARDYWKSPRPWYTERSVKLYVEPIYSYGYPSGHTTTFGNWAYILGDLFPAKREAFLNQAWSVGGNRIGGGAHYPHDIRGGKALAAITYEAMKDVPAYREAFAAAKAEIAKGGKLH